MKRAFDVVGALLVLVLFSPFMIGIAFLIHRSMGSPILFRQIRIGFNGTPFEMVKFRSMRDAFDSSGNPLPDGERLTPLGRFMRARSLDEAPELWNVIKGDMSLVGPRPLLTEYLPLYSSEQARRHTVKPGITGWAQVNGRNAISWEERFALDIWYVENQSFWLDLKILLRTVLKVVRREGVSAESEATMPKFTGSRES